MDPLTVKISYFIDITNKVFINVFLHIDFRYENRKCSQNKGIQRDWELFFSLKNQSFVNFEVCILICFSYLPEEVICNKKTKINTEFEFHALKTLETVAKLCIFFYGEHKS